MLRTVSTLFSADGRLQGAKIDLATGEIRQHDYKSYFVSCRIPQPKPNAADIEPFWMQMPTANHSAGIPLVHDSSRTTLFNGAKMYLQHLLPTDDPEYSWDGVPFTEVVQSQLPELAEIIESAKFLRTSGSTRGFIRAEVLAMLANLDVITSEAVRRFKGCSVRHSQRIAGYLRVIVIEFMAQVEASPAGPRPPLATH